MVGKTLIFQVLVDENGDAQLQGTTVHSSGGVADGIGDAQLQGTTLLSLPENVLLHVLSHVAAQDLQSIFRSCHSMLELSRNPILAALWLHKHRPDSAVTLAAKHSADAMLQLFRLFKCSTTAKDSKQVAPLDAAVFHGHHSMVGYLCSREEVRAQPCSAFANALYGACSLGRVECVRHLLTLPPSIVHVNTPLGLGDNTPLHIASWKGHVAVVDLLISLGAQSGIRNSRGRLPLHVAAASGALDVVRFLLSDERTRPTCISRIDEPDNRGRTALHLAASHSNLDCCKELVAAGAQSMLRRDSSFKTPIDVAKGELRSLLGDHVKGKR
ncbi:ankyrin repeat-containing domain protein [Dunaliella salina]|uniref:Ankyrin repeat-containing domain protein n=1 Tax=Dunaliella salina TaxID=3046 RepID=A0ABQ7GTE9_DUNSA|nr:ankyrin repeat-containing domain protein [Dunaliella salina]|eukprot:KAF5837886.1 ankyrin repeat-containing domain protein [Dunaliella salina]